MPSQVFRITCRVESTGVLIDGDFHVLRINSIPGGEAVEAADTVAIKTFSHANPCTELGELQLGSYKDMDEIGIAWYVYHNLADEPEKVFDERIFVALLSCSEESPSVLKMPYTSDKGDVDLSLIFFVHVADAAKYDHLESIVCQDKPAPTERDDRSVSVADSAVLLTLYRGIKEGFRAVASSVILEVKAAKDVVAMAVDVVISNLMIAIQVTADVALELCVALDLLLEESLLALETYLLRCFVQELVDRLGSLRMMSDRYLAAISSRTRSVAIQVRTIARPFIVLMAPFVGPLVAGAIAARDGGYMVRIPVVGNAVVALCDGAEMVLQDCLLSNNHNSKKL